MCSGDRDRESENNENYGNYKKILIVNYQKNISLLRPERYGRGELPEYKDGQQLASFQLQLAKMGLVESLLIHVTNISYHILVITYWLSHISCHMLVVTY